ncbi:MAG: DUF4013 domain-containing protein [Anaerolineae bacterium]|nr:DUF4013 domain-containing protein [Anaerolineae bacterium]
MLASLVIPILPGLVVAGYAIRIMRQAIEGHELSLPPWDDWGKLFLDGLRWTVLSIVFFLPGLIVMGIGLAGYLGGFFAGFTQETAEGAMAMLAGMGVYLIGLAVGMLLLALGAIPLPAATAHFVAQDNLASAFRVREWWPFLRANKLGYLIAWVTLLGLYYLGSFALGILIYTIVLCCLLPFAVPPATMYLSVFSAALFGRTYRESRAMLAGPEPTPEPATAPDTEAEAS